MAAQAATTNGARPMHRSAAASGTCLRSRCARGAYACRAVAAAAAARPCKPATATSARVLNRYIHLAPHVCFNSAGTEAIGCLMKMCCAAGPGPQHGVLGAL